MRGDAVSCAAVLRSGTLRLEALAAVLAGGRGDRAGIILCNDSAYRYRGQEIALLDQASDRLQRLRDQEKEILDGLPPLFHQGELGDQIALTIDQLDEALVDIDSASDCLAAHGGEPRRRVRSP